MIAKYKSGKCQAINLGGTIVKNGGGGFFLSNKLITTLKVGDKFKANDVLAYHKDFFTNSKFNNCRMNMGTLTKVGIMSTYNTYQDATMITEKFSEEASTEMVFVKQVSIGKNSNVEYMVKVGQEIKVGDSLIQFDDSYDDESEYDIIRDFSNGFAEGFQDGASHGHSGTAFAALAIFGITFIIIFLILMSVVILLDVFICNPIEVGCKRFYVRNLK